MERIVLDAVLGAAGLRGPVLRYGFLDRLRRCADANSVDLLAFGFGEREVRLVVDGGQEDIPNLLRGLKVGTIRAARAAGVDLVFAPPFRQVVSRGRLDHALAWAHHAPVEAGAPCPLASPWSSHRDLLGYRVADFYDPADLRGRADPRRVHDLCRGLPLPRRPRARPARDPLSLLLRVAGGVLGLLPSDRRCFRLFVHLARNRGWTTRDVAAALALTRRRVRQLSEGREPLVRTALVSVEDPRLCRVP